MKLTMPKIGDIWKMCGCCSGFHITDVITDAIRGNFDNASGNVVDSVRKKYFYDSINVPCRKIK